MFLAYSTIAQAAATTSPATPTGTDGWPAVVVAAFVTAAFSAVVAIGSLLFTHFTKRSQDEAMARLRSELDEWRSESNARRDYEYEARKRLYDHCEPLLFQFAELADGAAHRVASLARSASRGELRPDGTGWLSQEGYYLRSTLYNLLVPLTIYKLIKTRLTVLDFSVEPRLRHEYEMMQALYISFTDDFGFAGAAPALVYSPNVGDWRERREAGPARYWRQGLPIGILDSVAEAMIVSPPDQRQRYMSFGEFDRAMREREDVKNSVRLASDLFLKFHPQTRPVLWRILAFQVSLYQHFATRHKAHLDGKAPLPPPPLDPGQLATRYDWRGPGSQVPAEELNTPFEIARQMLDQKLPSLTGTMGRPAPVP